MASNYWLIPKVLVVSPCNAEYRPQYRTDGRFLGTPSNIYRWFSLHSTEQTFPRELVGLSKSVIYSKSTRLSLQQDVCCLRFFSINLEIKQDR